MERFCNRVCDGENFLDREEPAQLFGRVESLTQARAKCINGRTYYAIAEYDLGHQASFETSAGDDVIPRSWTMQYTASCILFFFEKNCSACTAMKEKQIGPLLRLSACLVGLDGEGLWMGDRW